MKVALLITQAKLDGIILQVINKITNKLIILSDNIINKTMQTIKFLSNNQILLNNQLHQGYTIGELPNTFGFIYNQDKDQDGISEWFNFKGLTYVRK